jgi:CelD/BcsL family acetyltransferase involved in cellulose biosynthesis
MDMANAKAFRTDTPAFLRDAAADSHIRSKSLEEVDIPAFRAAWDVLVAQAGEPNPFFEPWLLIPALKHWGSGVTIKAWYHYGRLAGLLPLRTSADYYGHRLPHMAGWLHPNAFCGAPLIVAGHEEAFWRAVLNDCDRAAGRALFLHLPKLPADSPALAALDRVLAACPRAHYTAEEESRAVLTGGSTAAAYLESAMSAKKRKELRRQRTRLAEEGALTFDRVEGNEGLTAWTEEFLALEAAGWKGAQRSALASAGDTRAFFAETLAGAATAGRLERLALRINGRAIALLANFITTPGAFSFKTAFDENYARFSPGMLLQLENLALLERPGIRWTDSCAVEGHPMIERLWRGKRTLVSRNVAIGGPLRRTAFRLIKAYETRPRKTEKARPS